MEKIQVSPSNMDDRMFAVNISHLVGYDLVFSDNNQAQMVARAIDKMIEKLAPKIPDNQTYEEKIEPLLRILRNKNDQGKILWTGDHTFTYSEMLALILNGDPRGSAYADAWLEGRTSNLMEEVMKNKK